MPKRYSFPYQTIKVGEFSINFQSLDNIPNHQKILIFKFISFLFSPELFLLQQLYFQHSIHIYLTDRLACHFGPTHH